MFLLELSENTKIIKVIEDAKNVLDTIESMPLHITPIVSMGFLENSIEDIVVTLADTVFTFCFNASEFSYLRVKRVGDDCGQEGYFRTTVNGALDIFTNYCAKVRKLDILREKLTQTS